jgi:hypothetical protein
VRIAKYCEIASVDKTVEEKIVIRLGILSANQVVFLELELALG